MPTPRRTVLAALLSAGALAACGSPATFADAAPADAAPLETPAPVPGRPELPDGWRWESYRDVQLAVPGDWGWINGGQRTHQWCVGGAEGTAIGRPGGSTMAFCHGNLENPSPGTLIASNGTFAAFGHAEEAGVVGDRKSIHVGDVAVMVQAEPELRERILATAHTIEVDSNGCPVRDEVTDNPGLAPSPAVAFGDLVDVRSVAACRYTVDWIEQLPPGAPSLKSSVRLTGRTAAETLAAVASAPAAGGQDRPESCYDTYGGEMVVLLIESAAGTSRAHLRFSGCDHNAVDDGVSPRRLTPAVRPFFSGPNLVLGMSNGPGKLEAVTGGRLGEKRPPQTAPPG